MKKQVLIITFCNVLLCLLLFFVVFFDRIKTSTPKFVEEIYEEYRIDEEYATYTVETTKNSTYKIIYIYYWKNGYIRTLRYMYNTKTQEYFLIEG